MIQSLESGVAVPTLAEIEQARVGDAISQGVVAPLQLADLVKFA